ncbi:MAG: class I SAM-dependent methyltransferase [Victivallales bacterium]|nr:class I SAM-dependent methyltransferase [Victivallales bacterium]
MNHQASRHVYSALNPAAFFMIQGRMREIRRILADSCPEGCSDLKMLEIGCGNGQWLAEFQAFGFLPANLAGIEINTDRADAARARLPVSDIKNGDASSLPWSDKSFDIVFQSTVFTSVTAGDAKAAIASEMKRVCKKNGFILWYDFAFDNPRNPDVKGVGKREISKLFSPWICEFRRATLAPPIARQIVPFSRLLADVIETACPPLRTHIVAKIYENEPIEEFDVDHIGGVGTADSG